MLPVTLLRYTDAKSRSLPILFIKEAVLKHPEVVAKTVNTALLENVLMWKNTAPTRSLAKHCLAALAWSQTAVSGKVTIYVLYKLVSWKRLNTETDLKLLLRNFRVFKKKKFKEIP